MSISTGSQKHLLIEMFDSAKRTFYKMARSYLLKTIRADEYTLWAKGLFKKKNMGKEPFFIFLKNTKARPDPIFF